MRLLVVSFALVLAGCIEDRSIYLPDVEQTKVTSFEIPQASPPPVDVLIVVDNGPGMAAHEARVRANLPVLAAQIAGVGWDLHVGIVTGDVGCTPDVAWRYDSELTNNRFLIDWKHLDASHTKNFAGELADHIVRLADVGHAGCGAFRPLDAIAAALDPAQQFRRPDAALVVVAIGASDDQSVTAIDALVAQLDPFHHRVIGVAIAPTTAARLAAFVERLEFPSTRVAIDAPGYGVHLWFSDGGWWGAPCIESPAITGRCAMSDIVRDRETDAIVYDQPLPACGPDTPLPCWRFEAQPSICTIGPHHLALAIDRHDFPPQGTVTSGQCEIAEIP